MAQVISIVSGKGGSGKSLLTAVLGRALSREGKNVLLVDMDIFVRGLTVMLFSFKKPKSSNESATISDLLGVFENDSENRDPVLNAASNLYIERFFECDILPAVKNISSPLDYDDRNLSNENFCKKIIMDLLALIRERYDYIFIDCRAGMDSLVSAICNNADIVISVAEDDEIGRQTNSNLVKFLQYHKKINVVYSILNKASNIYDYTDVKKRSIHRSEFSVLGVIPFDIEILNNFGSDRFWTLVTETLYFRSLMDVWNQLSRSEQVQEISESKYKFPPKIFMNKKQGRYSLAERMLRMYSVFFIMAGAFFWVWDKYRYSNSLNMFETISILSVLIGILTLILSTSGFLWRKRVSIKDYEKNYDD